jgi:hypothetical protein
MLQEARLNTRWDFLFIVGYVFVLTFVSYNRMQRSPRFWLNTLLRLSFVLIITAGLCDIVENCILLSDIVPTMLEHPTVHLIASAF